MPRMRRVLLLGGTGFIGSHVLAVLRRRKDVRLMMLAHRNVDFRALEDVNLVVDSLPRFDPSWIETFRPDTIIHLARLRGSGPVRRSLAARKGCRANRRLITWLRKLTPDVHVVYVSGTLVYGDHGEHEVDERTALNPVSFAREYVRAETPWMEAQQEEQLPVTIVRPPWVVGPGSWFHHHYVFPALKQGAVPLYGSGGNWMTFLDIRDCAGAIVHLAERSEPGKVFNLFTPGQVALQSEFAQVLSDVLGVGIRQVDSDGLRRYRDPAVWEALTFSLRGSTINGEVRSGYQFEVPRWPDMIARNLPTA